MSQLRGEKERRKNGRLGSEQEEGHSTYQGPEVSSGGAGLAAEGQVEAGGDPRVPVTTGVASSMLRSHMWWATLAIHTGA